MPSHDGLTLCDLLSMVPELLHTCLSTAWSSNGAGIRELRLISKKFGWIASTAITSCTVCLGGEKSPSPEQICSLVQGARLQHLTVIISTCAGLLHPSIDQRTATCTAQMQFLLTSMRESLHIVKHLTLHVDFVSSQESEPEFIYIHTVSPVHFSVETRVRLAEIADMSQQVFGMLPFSLPKLQWLTLSGRCRDVALDLFGHHCLNLRRLDVEVVAFPIHALQGIERLVPLLTHFTLTRGPDVDRACLHYVQAYLIAALPLLHGCSHLTTLQLALQPEDEHDEQTRSDVLHCPREVWDGLPLSVIDVRCDVKQPNLLQAESLMARLRVLTMNQSLDEMSLPCFLLEHAFCLESLTLTCSEEIYLIGSVRGDREMESLADLASLRTRLLSGFQFSCPAVVVFGNCGPVQDILSWLLPLRHTRRCTIEALEDAGKDNANLLDMDMVSRSFPNCESLKIKDVSLHGRIWRLDEELLIPLKGCSLLRSLSVKIEFRFTHAGLRKLCLSLPSLMMLSCYGSRGVCYASVAHDLVALGRDVTISEHVVEHDDFFFVDPVMHV